MVVEITVDIVLGVLEDVMTETEVMELVAE
jgi:hypothetical protein